MVVGGAGDTGDHAVPGAFVAGASFDVHGDGELTGISRQRDDAYVIGGSVQSFDRTGGAGFVSDDCAGWQEAF